MKVRAFLGIFFLALLSSMVPAQSTPPADQSASAAPAGPPPAFVIADVHTSPHVTRPFYPGPFRTGDRYILRQATMLDLISTAYGVDASNASYIQDGPSWLEWDRFDIVAKVPPATPPDTIKLMLRSLLADRFKLAAHNGIKPMPAYVLTVGKGKPNLKDSDGTGEPGCKYLPPPPSHPPNTPFDFAFSCHNTSMESFMQTSLNWGQQDYMNSLPIVDSTGLKGTYDFDIHWTGFGWLGRAGSEGTTVFTAVDKQLGLKLDLATAPRPVLIVDSVNEKPTPNSADLEKILPPPPPPEFEVATVKPSKPDEQGIARITKDEVMIQGLPLKFAITFAWDLSPNDSDVLVGAPKWLDSDHFDIDGKVSSDVQVSAGQGMPMEQEDLRQMLRALLIDRFQMKVHMEDRPIDEYVFVAVNPKLKKADPSSRTHCVRGPGPDEKDPRYTNPTMNGLIHCQNVTIAQFGEQLQFWAPGYIHNQIFDATNLPGTWDLTLGWSSADQVRAGGAGGSPPAAGDTSAPSDPSGAVSLIDAIPKWLGLKLEKQKRPIPVLVIDHMEEKPTEN